MITINGLKFQEIPTMCGCCSFYRENKKDKNGWCMTFEIYKRKYDHVPVKCMKLFEKGFAIGGDLVITVKD